VSIDFSESAMSLGIRLQKILSSAGVVSRRAAETLITDGRVTVNRKLVTTLGTRADPTVDVVRVDGRRVGRPGPRRYLIVNKPRGYVTTRRDPEKRKTVLNLIPDVKDYVYPVGRLDYDSEGLLLLTNDGELAERLTHPSHGFSKVYEVTIRGVPSEKGLRRLSNGVLVEGRRTVPLNVQLLVSRRPNSSDQSRVRMVLREGRNRQVRRMFDAIGHPVRRLRRTRFGPLRLGSLRIGGFRELDRHEIEALCHAVSPRRSSGGSQNRKS